MYPPADSMRRTCELRSALRDRAREPAEVLAVDADFHAVACLLAEGLQNRIARLAEHLNPDRRVERLRVRLLRALADDSHVRLHRRGVRVDLDDGYFVAGFVDILVEGDQPRLVRLDEFDETRHARSLAFELSRLQPVCRDED